MKTNPKSSEIAKQIKSAFDFLQKLYSESSYLIKEIEGSLSEIDEYKFRILRPSGYGISVRSSTGLESNNVNLWLMRKFSVGFVDIQDDENTGSQTVTEINEQLRVLYFKVILDEKGSNEPKLIFGVFYDIEKKDKNWIKKFENIMGSLEYIDNKIFSKFPNVDYEDGNYKIKGKFEQVHLLDINSSDELQLKVINPVIELYNSII